jgi:hypothetical protein
MCQTSLDPLSLPERLFPQRGHQVSSTTRALVEKRADMPYAMACQIPRPGYFARLR